MSDRSLKKSLSGKTNRPVDFDADENLDLFSVNRTSLNPVLLKPARRSFEQASDEKKHVNDSLCTIPEVPLGTLPRSVLEAKIVTFKLPSNATTKAASKSETDPSSKPTRSSSTIRASNIPTLRPSNIPTLRPSNIPTLRPSNIPSTLPTVRSSSVPKKTSTSASVSAPKRTVSRSLTPVSRKITSPSLIPVSRKIPSRSPTPTRVTSTTPSFKNTGDASRSRSLTPRSKPLIASTSTSVTSSSKTKVRSVSASVPSRPSLSSTPRTPPRTAALPFGKPGNVNSPKRNTSPDVTRTRPKGPSSSLIPTFSHTTSSQKSVKSSTTVTDSTRLVKKSSKASVQSATNTHLDVSRNGKMSTMLYPHSIRTSSSAPVLRKRYGSEGSSSSNQEEEEGKSLAKEEETEKKDSARYDALLDVKDVMDTNWLLNLDDQLNHSLIFEYTFDSPPEPFSPL